MLSQQDIAQILQGIDPESAKKIAAEFAAEAPQLLKNLLAQKAQQIAASSTSAPVGEAENLALRIIGYERANTQNYFQKQAKIREMKDRLRSLSPTPIAASAKRGNQFSASEILVILQAQKEAIEEFQAPLSAKLAIADTARGFALVCAGGNAHQIAQARERVLATSGLLYHQPA